jgi:hypothetical protein
MTSSVACTFNNNQSWYKRTKKCVSQIKVSGQFKHLGYLHNENQAAAAYNAALHKARKDHAAAVDVKRKWRTRTLNEIPEDQLIECEQIDVKLPSNAPEVQAPGSSQLC